MGENIMCEKGQSPFTKFVHLKQLATWPSSPVSHVFLLEFLHKCPFHIFHTVLLCPTHFCLQHFLTLLQATPLLFCKYNKSSFFVCLSFLLLVTSLTFGRKIPVCSHVLYLWRLAKNTLVMIRSKLNRTFTI